MRYTFTGSSVDIGAVTTEVTVNLSSFGGNAVVISIGPGSGSVSWGWSSGLTTPTLTANTATACSSSSFADRDIGPLKRKPGQTTLYVKSGDGIDVIVHDVEVHDV